MGETSRYALSRADGSPIYYTLSVSTSPSPAPEPAAFALLDGIGCHGFVWKYLQRDLEAQGHVVHMHYRGHGRSPRPRDPARVTMADLADDLASVLDDAGIGRATLFGHSMGVQVALESYRRHRDRVGGLVLVCGGPGHPLRTFRGNAALEALLPRIRATVARAPRLFNRAARTLIPTRLAFALASALEVNDSLVELPDFMPYLRGLAQVDVDLFFAMLTEAGQHSATDLLPDVRVPTLIIAGERDGFTPPELSQAMYEAIPGAEIVTVEGGSHTAPIERPHFVGRTVAEFTRRRLRATVQSTA